MIFYILIFSFIFICSLLDFFRLIKRTNKLLYFIAIILILFAGLRWNTGTDFNQYYRLFNMSITGNDILQVEHSYYYLSCFLKDFRLVLLFYSFVTIFLSLCFIRKFKYPFSALFLYYCFTFLSYNMGRMRQGLSLAICMFSLLFLFKKEYLKYLLCVFLSIFIHKSSIVFLIALPLSHFVINKKFMVITVILAIVLSFVHIDKFIGVLFTQISFLSKYAEYFSTGSEFSYFSFSLSNFRRAIMLFAFIYFIDYKKIANRSFINFFYFGTLIFYLFKDFPVISERVGYYYCISEIFLIPLLASSLKSKYLGFIFQSAYGLYYFINMITLNESDWYNEPYVPYNNWLHISMDTNGNIFMFILLLSAFLVFVYIFVGLKLNKRPIITKRKVKKYEPAKY